MAGEYRAGRSHSGTASRRFRGLRIYQLTVRIKVHDGNHGLLVGGLHGQCVGFCVLVTEPCEGNEVVPGFCDYRLRGGRNIPTNIRHQLLAFVHPITILIATVPAFSEEVSIHIEHAYNCTFCYPYRVSLRHHKVVAGDGDVLFVVLCFKLELSLPTVFLGIPIIGGLAQQLVSAAKSGLYLSRIHPYLRLLVVIQTDLAGLLAVGIVCIFSPSCGHPCSIDGVVLLACSRQCIIVISISCHLADRTIDLCAVLIVVRSGVDDTVLRIGFIGASFRETQVVWWIVRLFVELFPYQLSVLVSIYVFLIYSAAAGTPDVEQHITLRIILVIYIVGQLQRVQMVLVIV